MVIKRKIYKVYKNENKNMIKICQNKSQPKHKEKSSDKRGVGSQGQKAEQNGMLLFSEYDIQFVRLLKFQRWIVVTAA